MPKKRRAPPRPRAAAKPPATPDAAPASAEDASTVARVHYCKEYKLATESPFVALKVLAAAPASSFICAVEALGVLIGYPLFTTQAYALIQAGAFDAIERAIRARADDFTAAVGTSRPLSTLHRLATVVGNAIRHFGHACDLQPPAKFALADLEGFAARLRALAKGILRGIEPDRLKGADVDLLGGLVRQTIEQNARCSFAAWLIVMLEPELGLRSELTHDDCVTATRVLGYHLVNGDDFDCAHAAFDTLNTIDRMRQASTASFSLWDALCGSDADMVERLTEAAHEHAKHVRTVPRPPNEMCMEAAQGLVNVLNMFESHSSFGVPMLELWTDKGIVADLVHVAREARRVHDYGVSAVLARNPACHPQQCAVDLISSTLQRAYGWHRSDEIVRIIVDGDNLQLLNSVGPAMQHQVVRQTSCAHEFAQMAPEPRARDGKLGNIAILLPEGVRPTLCALASIVRERSDVALSRACAFRLRPVIFPAVQRLQGIAATDPAGAASYALVIEAWRALADLVGVREERCCGEPGCRSRATRMKLCGSCKAIYYCSKECAKRHWHLHSVICSADRGQLMPGDSDHGHDFKLVPITRNCPVEVQLVALRAM